MKWCNRWPSALPLQAFLFRDTLKRAVARNALVLESVPSWAVSYLPV